MSRRCKDSLSRALTAVSAALGDVGGRKAEKLCSKTWLTKPSPYQIFEADSGKTPRRKVNTPRLCDAAPKARREESRAAL